MPETKRVHLFDIKPIMSDVEEVIQRGLNKMLVNYIERHEMLEKTHQQLMLLPSIAEEFKMREHSCEIDSESEHNEFTNANGNINLIHEQISHLENKLQRMEKKYDSIIPILDKLVNKITNLNDDLKSMKQSETKVGDTTGPIEKSSVVKTSENENIEIRIQEPEDSQDEDLSDDEDVNPLLITCSTISLKKEAIQENVEESKVEVLIEEDEELSVEEELGIEETYVKEESKEVVEECSEDDENKEVEESKVEVLIEEELGIEEEEEVLEQELNQEEEKEVEEPSEAEEEESVEEEEEVEESSEAEEETEEEEDAKDPIQEKELEEPSEAEEETEEEEEEEASVETETKEEVEEDEDDEEIFEIDIDDKTYCTNDDENGFIWELSEEGEQGAKVGYLKDGEPFFYADEN